MNTDGVIDKQELREDGVVRGERSADYFFKLQVSYLKREFDHLEVCGVGFKDKFFPVEPRPLAFKQT